MAWAMLIINAFDPESDYQKKMKADILLKTDSNPFGKEFGTIYSALTGTDKEKADKELAAMCLKS